MPSDRSRDALGHIRQHILEAQDFTRGMSEATFAADRRTFHAVVRCLSVISEASRRLSPEIRERHPGVPWPEVAGAGNVYRHGYDIVRVDAVWATVTRHLPPLLAVVEAELAAEP